MSQIGKLIVALWLSVFISTTAQAAHTWEICKLQIQVTRIIKNPEPAIRGKVMSVLPQSNDAECPKEAQILSFVPESKDYQTLVPRRKWPRTGDNIKLRYIYLDGFCKNDGDTAPCRVKHYPLGW